jgi:tRNA(Arg) A34 adenosine deaminase TadA
MLSRGRSESQVFSEPAAGPRAGRPGVSFAGGIDDNRAMSKEPPPPPASPALQEYWARPVHELATVSAGSLGEADAERHRVYSLLVLSLVAHYFNGNKYGAQGAYHDRRRQELAPDLYRGHTLAARRGEPAPGHVFDYLGHNIACIAVDGRGSVIDFDFNHNEVWNSSVEHAESRLVRRVFSLAQRDLLLGAEDEKRKGVEYSNILSDVTVYTSLESCAQCAGIMTLAKVREVVYLQTDPGMYGIGNILYNLTHDSAGRARGVPAPLPIPGSAFGLRYFQELDSAYDAFTGAVGAESPFFRRGDYRKTDGSITSFLCTDTALDIFERGRRELAEMTSLHPAHAPRAGALTNDAVLKDARRFLDYAIELGDRGTPHRL